jgi:hypothetical protein
MSQARGWNNFLPGHDRAEVCASQATDSLDSDISFTCRSPAFTMAPGVPVVQNDIEAQLKDIVQNLYNLIVQGYDHRGPATEDAMKRETYSLHRDILQSPR